MWKYLWLTLAVLNTARVAWAYHRGRAYRRDLRRDVAQESQPGDFKWLMAVRVVFTIVLWGLFLTCLVG